MVKLWTLIFFKKNKPLDGKIQINKSAKIGIALGGGGARGFGHIGALKAFEELGVKFDYIAGTSVGSVVGGLYAFGKTADEIAELAKKMKKSDIIKNAIPFIKPSKKHCHKL